MISPAINEIILRIFDHAAQGLPCLLENLKALLQCQSIHLSSSFNNHSAANDFSSTMEEDWHDDDKLLTSSHSAFIAADTLTKKIKLTIKQDSDKYLILQFSELSSLKKCLLSQDLNELVPHIQQAVLIAEQISQQRGDVSAIHFVISHQPFSLRNLSQASQDTFTTLPLDEQLRLTPTEGIDLEPPKYNLAIAANSEIEFSVSKVFLKQCYKLTPSEAELAQLVFKGLSLQEISNTRHVSKETTRKQFQSVLKKTHCESQEALIIKIFEDVLTRLDSQA